ncbi:MAG: phosphatidylglycerol lysyltransferase domain-containing protein, partial [Roseimicrobium sp.]
MFSVRVMMILGADAKNLDREEKWRLLSPHFLKHGKEALAYATLQQGMEYFVHDLGYISFTSVTHPVFARKLKRIVLSDPVCAPENMRALIEAFMKENPFAVFAVISEECARILRLMGFKANTVGYEPVLDVQTYNTKGNWKELDMIKRARNEAKREGITIREVDISTVPKDELNALSARWIGGKKVNDREIWVYARRPVYEPEHGVRKFVALDRDGVAVGYVFYDPMYRDGKPFGYSANTVRCDEQRYGRLATAIHMTAIDTFKPEGIEVLNLLMCPFVKLDLGIYNDDWATKMFFMVSERYGNEIYNFKGLSFHKSKYRGTDRPVYFASNSPLPSNDVYLAFLTSDITNSYFSTMGRLLKGVIKETMLK